MTSRKDLIMASTNSHLQIHKNEKKAIHLLRKNHIPRQIKFLQKKRSCLARILFKIFQINSPRINQLKVRTTHLGCPTTAPSKITNSQTSPNSTLTISGIPRWLNRKAKNRLTNSKNNNNSQCNTNTCLRRTSRRQWKTYSTWSTTTHLRQLLNSKNLKLSHKSSKIPTIKKIKKKKTCLTYLTTCRSPLNNLISHKPSLNSSHRLICHKCLPKSSLSKTNSLLQCTAMDKSIRKCTTKFPSNSSKISFQSPNNRWVSPLGTCTNRSKWGTNSRSSQGTNCIVSTNSKCRSSTSAMPWGISNKPIWEQPATSNRPIQNLLLSTTSYENK